MIKIPVKVENRNGFKYKLCVPFKFESKNYDSYVPGIPNVPNSHVSESPLSGIPTKMSCISGYSGAGIPGTEEWYSHQTSVHVSRITYFYSLSCAYTGGFFGLIGSYN